MPPPVVTAWAMSGVSQSCNTPHHCDLLSRSGATVLPCAQSRISVETQLVASERAAVAMWHGCPAAAQSVCPRVSVQCSAPRRIEHARPTVPTSWDQVIGGWHQRLKPRFECSLLGQRCNLPRLHRRLRQLATSRQRGRFPRELIHRPAHRFRERRPHFGTRGDAMMRVPLVPAAPSRDATSTSTSSSRLWASADALLPASLPRPSLVHVAPGTQVVHRTAPLTPLPPREPSRQRRVVPGPTGAALVQLFMLPSMPLIMLVRGRCGPVNRRARLLGRPFEAQRVRRHDRLHTPRHRSLRGVSSG